MKTCLCYCILGLFISCGSGGTGSDAIETTQRPTGSSLSIQEEMSEEDFLQIVQSDDDLLELKQSLVSQGYDNFIQAGVLGGDDGMKLEYAVYGSNNGDEKSVVRYCKGDDCIRSIAYIDGEVVKWCDKAGAEIPVQEIPLPPLLRQSKTQKLEEGTDLVPLASGLTKEEPIDPSSINLSKRRLIFANQFGPETGLKLQDVAGKITSSGLFTEIVEDNYVTLASIEKYLSTSYPQEVLVIIGQSIRKLYKDNKDPAKRWYRTVGLAYSSGIYGFKIATADMLANAFDKAPFHGPGLILLVGSESLGDGTEGMVKPKDTIPYYFNVQGQVVAGFVHQAEPIVVITSARIFLDSLAQGMTVKEAKDHVNGILEKWGEKLRIEFAGEPDENMKIEKSPASFWGDKVPKSADMAMYVHLRPWCRVAPGKPEVADDEKQANPGFKDMKIDGPVFRGSHEIEIKPGEFLKTEIIGVFGEIRKDAHFYFVLKGDLKPEFKGITLYCNARILEVVDEGGKRVIRFDGSAKAPFTYTSLDGKTCSLHDTDLEPMIEGTGVSQITINF